MITLVLSLYAFMSFFTVVCFTLATALGAEVKQVELGFPRLFTVGRVKLGLLPLSSSVELAGRAKASEGNWFQLGLGRRLAITLLPWVAYAVPAVLLSPRAPSSIANGFTQLFVTPNLTPLVRAFLALVRAAPASAIVGVVFAKGFVANTPIAAGNLLYELRGRGALFNVVVLMGLLLWVGGRLAWAIAHALI